MRYKYQFPEDWRDIDKIIVYGMGKTGVGNIDKLICDFKVPLIIDNNPEFTNQHYHGIPIFSLKHAMDKIGNTKIVILAAGKALLSIKKDLEEVGLRENLEFVPFDIFVVEWYFRFRGECCMGKVTTSVTTRCTFKCKNCNLHMPYHIKPGDEPLERLKKDVDKWFSFVDYVSEFAIVGGEPFLYKELEIYIQYLGEKYGSRIGNIQVITNGSVLPSQQLLKAMRASRVEVRISDYTNTLQYGNRLTELETVLNKEKIRYVIFKQTEWLDFGFPLETLCMGHTAEELRQHMLTCKGFCHYLQEGRYYYCGNAWAAEKCGLYQLKETDYIELESLEDNSAESKEKLIDFYLGNMESGYMSYCQVCRGFATNKVIPAAIQAEKEIVEKIRKEIGGQKYELL